MPTKTVHILHNSEQPASVFSILESGPKNIHVIADGLFDLLMMKLSQHYTSKKQTKIESKGPRFELGDFCVKLGSVTMNQNFKGILIEVSNFLFREATRCRRVRNLEDNLCPVFLQADRELKWFIFGLFMKSAIDMV